MAAALYEKPMVCEPNAKLGAPPEAFTCTSTQNKPLVHDTFGLANCKSKLEGLVTCAATETAIAIKQPIAKNIFL